MPALKGTYKPTPAPIPKSVEVPTPTPAPKKTKSTPAPADSGMTGEIPFVPTPPPDNRAVSKKVVDNGDDEAKVKVRYREIKAVALEDKSVQALKDKADAAMDDSNATKAYYKALFSKMRALDPSLTDHINRMEKAIVKRLDGGDASQ